MTPTQRRDLLDALTRGEIWTALRLRECRAVGMLDNLAAIDLPIIQAALVRLGKAPGYGPDGKEKAA